MSKKTTKTEKSTKIPWWQPQIGKYEYELIKKVLTNNFPNEGPLTHLFEEKLATLLGIPYVIAVPNATSAIFLSLKALGIGQGDEVIVPDLTFIATANAAEMTGARVVLCDVDPETVNLDPDRFEQTITKKTRAVIPVHVSGRAANLEKITTIAKKYNIAVIEDAAEAFMSQHNGKYLGTFGITGCFSLSPAKTITTGQGGFIVTSNEDIYKTLKKLKDQGRPQRGTGGDDIHESIGYNFKYTDLQAAVGLGQLHYLQKRIKRLVRHHILYQNFLSGIPDIKLFPFAIDKGEIPQWTDAAFTNRSGLDEYLQKQYIDCRRFWLPIHTQQPYKQSDKNFSVSTKISKNILWLPSAYTLTDVQIKRVCNAIKSFYS